MAKNGALRRTFLLALAVHVAACGYRLVGTEVRPPGDIRSVSIGDFENRSREFGLGKALTFAFEREFYRRDLLRVVESRDRADATLAGVIRRIEVHPVAFDAKDEALRYEAQITLDVQLKRRRDGAVLWQVSGLHAIEEYSAAVRVVIASSSQFQRQTLDPRDLQQLTDIQLAETEKRLAIERLVGDVVRDVHDRLLEGF